MHETYKKELYDCIVRDVFVSARDARIVNSSGVNEIGWLMDFRRVLLRPRIATIVAELVYELAGPTPFQIGGIEVAAIPMVTAVVMKSVEKGNPVNGFFIRKSRKKTGLLNMIEGVVTDDRIILVDDIIHSGGSIMRQVAVIESLGRKVDTVITILRFRDESYYTALREHGITLISLFELDDFTASLPVHNYVSKHTPPTPYPYAMLWHFTSPGAYLEYVVPKSQPVLSDGIIYFGSDSGIFWALDATTGETIWTHKVLFGVHGKSIFSTPVVYKDTVFFGAYDGTFYALNKYTGKKQWVAWHADWIGSSPCVAHDLGLVYVGMEFGFWKVKGGVAAYDAVSGTCVWQSHSSEYTHGSPTYSIKNKVVVCGSNDGLVYGLHARTGKVLWTYNAGGEVKAGCALSRSERYVACGSFAKMFVVLETKTGKEVARFETMEGNYSTPAWEGDDAIVCSSLDKRIYKFSIKTKTTVWEYVTSARVFASPLIDDGKVYCGNNSARLYVLDLETGKEVALFQATERITNQITVDRQKKILYVPTFANEIIALTRKDADVAR